MTGPQADGRNPLPQGQVPGAMAWPAEAADLCGAAMTTGADQYGAFLTETARDYSRLWAALPTCVTPDRAAAAWQEFWMARMASYAGAAFRSAAAPTLEVELAAKDMAAHRLPD